MTLEEYRNKKKGQTISSNKYLNGLVKRTMFCFLFVLLVFCISLFSSTVRNYIKKYLLETNFEFSKISSIYNKYIGTLTNEETLPVNKHSDTSLACRYSSFPCKSVIICLASSC